MWATGNFIFSYIDFAIWTWKVGVSRRCSYELSEVERGESLCREDWNLVLYFFHTCFMVDMDQVWLRSQLVPSADKSLGYAVDNCWESRPSRVSPWVKVKRLAFLCCTWITIDKQQTSKLKHRKAVPRKLSVWFMMGHKFNTQPAIDVVEICSLYLLIKPLMCKGRPVQVCLWTKNVVALINVLDSHAKRQLYIIYVCRWGVYLRDMILPLPCWTKIQGGHDGRLTFSSQIAWTVWAVIVSPFTSLMWPR